MKRKVYFLFVLILFIMFIFSGAVNAEFSIQEAEKELDTNETYLEILGGEINIGPTKIETITSDSYNNIHKYTCNSDVPIEFVLHMFTRANSLKEEMQINVETEGLEAVEQSREYNSDGDDGVELKYKITMTDMIDENDTKNEITISIKWRVSNFFENRDHEVKIIVSFLKCDELIEKNIEASKKEEENLAEAYKTIPGADADYGKISAFIQSDSKYNNLNNFNNVSLETLEEWKKTYDKNGKWCKDDANYKIIEKRIENLKGNNDSYNSDDYINDINEEYDYRANSIKNQTMNLIDKLKGESRTEKPFDDIFDNPDYYNPTNETVSQDFTDKISVILTIITNIGMLVSVLMPAILGVKYMLASVDERAEYKKDMIPYLIGAALLFGISTIIKILQAVGQIINNI